MHCGPYKERLFGCDSCEMIFIMQQTIQPPSLIRITGYFAPLLCISANCSEEPSSKMYDHIWENEDRI